MTNSLAEFLADVVMTGYYLAEPVEGRKDSLHDAEVKCLKIISSFGPIQMQSLARCMHVTKPRVTQLVDCLVEKSLIEKSAGFDRRVTLVSATVKGNDIVAEARAKYLQLAETIEAKLGPDRAELFVDMLGEITPLSNSTVERAALNKR